MPQRNAKESPASRRANEALDRVSGGNKTPVKKALAFLLEGSHDEPSPDPAQTGVGPILTQTEPRPKAVQSPPRPSPIAPERNFNRRANSLEHSALPAGLFPGASKKIYDALYVRTRGAIQPTRTVQARHRDLLTWSGIRDVKTVKTHLGKLRELGLITWHTLKGEHEGSFYEVFLPEEVSPIPAQTEANPSPILKTDSDQAQKTDWVGLTDPALVSTTSTAPKTSFKTTTTDDDEPMPLLRRRVGKPMPKTEAVLLALLDTLETRTKGDISSHDALIAHVLRQKLQPKPNTAQRRPTGEPFTPPPVTEYSEEELAELLKIEAEIRAELSRD